MHVVIVFIVFLELLFEGDWILLMIFDNNQNARKSQLPKKNKAQLFSIDVCTTFHKMSVEDIRTCKTTLEKQDP